MVNKIRIKKAPSFKQEFIDRTVKSPIIWPREFKILKKLVEIYPEEGFWRGLELGFKTPSLAWCLTEKGKEFMAIEYKKFKFQPEPKREYNFDRKTEKSAKSFLATKKKIRTIQEFLELK